MTETMRANRSNWVAIFASLIILTTMSQAKTNINKQPFGHTADGTAVDLYTLADDKVELRITNYGGIIVSLRAPDRNGKSDDIVLGYDSLHGGIVGFDKVVWTAHEIKNGIELTYVSKDGDQGFPGTLTTTVRYTLDGNALRIEYSATTDKDTVLNLTNHSYFNLLGQAKGEVLGHVVKINASRITPVDVALIPTGELKSVEGTPFDFRTPHAIGERIDANDEQLHFGLGYDENFVLDHPEGQLAEAAEVYEPTTGRILK